jgi:SAM-dependent MidA family methyltransferase
MPRSSSPSRRISEIVHERGPITVAAFMELALYDPDAGYYARAAQRSGRAGDFFTSVDVGPVFGELLARQVIEMAGLLESSVISHQSSVESRAPSSEPRVDLVEAGAGNGRLSADILRAIRRRDAALYERLCLHLVEASATARAAQREVLAEVADRLVESSGDLPDAFEGVLIANELLDALPVHQVVMREDGLREVYVEARRLETGDWKLTTTEGVLSTPALADYLGRLNVTLEPAWRAEINLRAVEWMRSAARRLRRGFLVVIDYGHAAPELYSPAHSAGTLTTFAAHTIAGGERPAGAPGWLEDAGDRDITAHVDFSSVQAAAEDQGLTNLGFLDQTYFLMGLAADLDSADLKTRLALKTLVFPGGLGSSHKVLILGKEVGSPSLAGCSYRVRVT